jgi:dTDP-3-amino-3,4,6-trideoxy-alpha-D-glucose transaminase
MDRDPSAPAVPFVALDRAHARVEAELREAFDRVLRSSGFVLGEEVERFEDAWARWSGTEHCVGVASGTAAIALLLRAAGIGRGDEVIVPAHTFIATAIGVCCAGATPVLSDVEEATGLLDPDAAEAAVGPRTAAILAVHLYGQLCDMRRLTDLSQRHGLALFDDAAQAHGATCDERQAGTFGAGAAYSFYPSKNLGALGDGGAICTDDPSIARAARQLRNLGRERGGEHVVAGVNERLDGLQAAVLCVKLRHLAEGNRTRRAHAERYRSALGGRVRMLHERAWTPSVYHLFPVRVANRDAVAARLRDAGVGSGVHYASALHQHPALDGIAVRRQPLPEAEAWAAEELSLPMSPELDPGEVDRAALACGDALAATSPLTEHVSADG